VILEAAQDFQLAGHHLRRGQVFGIEDAILAQRLLAAYMAIPTDRKDAVLTILGPSASWNGDVTDDKARPEGWVQRAMRDRDHDRGPWIKVS
jgi:hypothetical protein